MTLNARFGLLAIAAASACNAACDFPPQYCEGTVVPDEPQSSTRESQVVAQVLPAETTAVDMLFVIDDSGSMTDEQYQLGKWSGEMFDMLSATGVLPDLHIAVTSSSVAIPGLAQCPTTGQLHVGEAGLKETRYLVDVAGPTGRVRNYTGKLTDTFSKMAKVGDAGCGFEQPFTAAQLALSGHEPGSDKFLRDDALLLVVFVTDEDDCSALDPTLFSDEYADACSTLGPITSYRCFEHGVVCHDGKGPRAIGERHNCRPDDDSRYEEPVTDFANYLKGLKKDPAQVVVAGIYGKPNGIATVVDEKVEQLRGYETPRLADVCGGSGKEGTGATPAVRMNGLMAKFGGRASQSSICESELSWAMHDVGVITRSAASRSRCLRGALTDTDTVAPGIQPSCRVEVASNVGTSLQTRIQLPPCDGAAAGQRCFTVAADAACAETETGLAFNVADDFGKETMTVSCDVDVDAELSPSIAETRN